MNRNYLAIALFLILSINSYVFAQEDDVRFAVDNRVNKMQKYLGLTDTQVAAITPIVKDYMVKHQEYLNDAAGQGIVDHIAVKTTLKSLKEEEYQRLGKILSKDQMSKWINKENMMAALNPDSPESAVSDDTGLTANGANFKF